MSTLEDLKEKYGRMLISQKDVARELGVSTKTVERLRTDGQLPYKMVMGSIRVHIKDLAFFIG